jgi:hypothetical protein
MVSDGVNIGTIWKNTTGERVTFPIAREKFVDLTATGSTFQTLVQQYINPGNTSLFPIFSKIAQNYEQYECKHLKVMFRTEEYMASGSVVSAGLACLSTNFDPDAANFATFTQAENYEHSISGAPFSGIIEHDILAEHRARYGSKSGRRGNDLSLNNYYVNYSPNQLAPGSTPAKFYDMGNFQFLVNQAVQAGLIGELWIEYSFTLIRRLQPAGSPQGGVAHFSAITGATGAQLTGMVLQPGYTLPGITMTGQVITLPAGIPGNYMMIAQLQAATSVGILTSSPSAGATSLYLQTSVTRDTQASLNSNAGTTTCGSWISQSFTLAATGGTITLNSPTVVGTGSGDIWFFSLPSTVLTVDEKEQIEIDELKSTQTSQNILINSLLTQMQSLQNEMRNLRVTTDSDFENEESCSSSSSTVANSSISKLSNSTIDAIGSLLARKQRC